MFKDEFSFMSASGHDFGTFVEGLSGVSFHYGELLC